MKSKTFLIIYKYTFFCIFFLWLGLIKASAIDVVENHELNQILSIEQIPVPLIGSLYKNTSEKRYIQSAFNMIQGLVNEKNEITSQSIAQFQKISETRLRAAQITIFFMFDLNGDYKVTRGEYDKVTQSSRGINPETLTLRPKYQYLRRTHEILSADKNKDGVIDLEEMKHSVDQRKVWVRSIIDMTPYLQLDMNRDGKLTLKEYKEILQRIFAYFDVNKNGTIDEAEFRLTREILNVGNNYLKRAIPKRPPLYCDYQKPSKQAKVIALGTSTGHVLSNISVAGQNKVTRIAKLKIEAGQEPLYIVAQSSSPIIWDIHGATDRVEKFVVLGARKYLYTSGSGVGVRGLHKDKIHFEQSNACRLSLLNKKKDMKKAAQTDLEESLEHKIDKFLIIGRVEELTLPSGKNRTFDHEYGGARIQYSDGNVFIIDKRTQELIPIINIKTSPRPKGVDPYFWARYYYAEPDGIQLLKTKDVISLTPPEPYIVRPSYAGLLQLMQEGKIIHLRKGSFFKIIKPISYPAGLAGSIFILGTDVPVPTGSPGFACVLREKSLETIINGSLCISYKKRIRKEWDSPIFRK